MKNNKIRLLIVIFIGIIFIGRNEIVAQFLCHNEGQGECNDQNKCTDDTCNEPFCVNTPIPGCCNTVFDCGVTNDPCQYYTCKASQCILNNVTNCCISNSQCDDGDVCTVDTCSLNKCLHTPIPECCHTTNDCLDANEICFDDFCNTAINRCYEVSNRTCCDSDNNCQVFANICQIATCIQNNTCEFQHIPGCCLSDSDCPITSACSTGTCNLTTNQCASTHTPGCCSVDSDCTSLAGTCQLARCNETVSQCYLINVTNCCTSDSQCDDGEFCTLDSCNNNTKQCDHVYKNDCCSANFTCPFIDPCTNSDCNFTTHSCYNVSVSPLCNVSTDFVVPIADCILNVSNGTLLARLRGHNFFWTTINITAGYPNNYFNPPPYILDQPSSFLPGHNIFLTPLTTDSLTWTLVSPDSTSRSATVNMSVTPFCGLYCNTDEDCTSLNTQCRYGTCSDNICVSNPIDCTISDPCIIESFCGVDLNDCVNFPYSCDDGNPCTSDSCYPLNGDPHCIHALIPGCSIEPLANTTCPNCNHTVTLVVDDCASLNITNISATEWNICHTSQYRGALSVTVLDFVPYSNCSISEQGSCSNHYSYPSLNNDFRCVSASVGTGGYCNILHSGVALTLPGISNTLQWDNSIVKPLMDVNNGYYAALTGSVYDPLNGTLRFQVDITFDQYVPNLPGNLAFPSSCYVQGGGTINTTTWQFFINAKGTIVASFGSPYYGLKLQIHSYSYTQLGVGANNVNTNYGLYSSFFYTIISQPFNSSYTIPAPSNNTYGYIYTDISSYPCNTTNSYCSQYTEPQLVPANGWSVSITGSNITYCRQFTSEELLGCHPFNEYGISTFSLVSNVSNVLVYSGNLYVTSVLPVTCFSNINSSQCVEEQVQKIHYPINISMIGNGTLSVSYTVSQVVVSASWIYNVWLIGSDIGDLEVIFRTCVEEIPDGSNFTQLMNGEILYNQSTTPLPFTFINSNVLCDSNSPFPYCCQTWYIRTHGAHTHNVVDFSGVIPIQFDVVVDGICREDITIYLDLHAKNEGRGTEISDNLCTRLDLYRDRYFQRMYTGDPMHPLVECDPLYALVSLCEDVDIFDIEIRKVSVCYLLNGNIPNFDPSNPSSTGCNAPGALRIIIYSEDPLDAPFIDPKAKFSILSDPPSGEDKEAFVFTVRPYTNYRQLLQVDWYALDMRSGNVLVEQMVEYEINDGLMFIDRNEIDEEVDDFYVRKCVFADPRDRCRERDIDIPLIFMDDDDDDDDKDHRHYNNHHSRDNKKLNDLKHDLDDIKRRNRDGDDDDEIIVVTKHKKEDIGGDDDGPSPISFTVIAILTLFVLILLFSVCFFFGFIPKSLIYKGKKPVRYVNDAKYKTVSFDFSEGNTPKWLIPKNLKPTG